MSQTSGAKTDAGQIKIKIQDVTPKDHLSAPEGGDTEVIKR